MRKSDLHEYQKYSADFIENNKVAAVFLDCGLGKTVISLTAIESLMFDRFEVSKVLVVSPLRVTNVWKNEVNKWEHLSDIRISVVTGTEEQRLDALYTTADVYVINRENVDWLINNSGYTFDFDMVVIDELSSFKNHKAKRFKSLMSVRPYIKRIVGLTGTPASNGLMDLWAEFRLLDGGRRLGRFISRFRDIYFQPDQMNRYTGVVYSYVPRPGAEDEIYEKISDITISMRAMDFLDMPECVFVNHEVEMDTNERRLYHRMKKDLVVSLDGEDVDAANAAVLSNKLLQMASGALYDAEGTVHKIHERKLDCLEDLIEQANGQSVLIAYWFRHDRERIMERFEKLKPRDIKTERDIEDWNNGKIETALISPQSAGHGLNIQKGGHILIWFSPVWSLELYQQTNCRLWRQGQTDTVTVHHIICKDTVDEDVMSALEKKDLTQSSLITAVKAQLDNV